MSPIIMDEGHRLRRWDRFPAFEKIILWKGLDNSKKSYNCRAFEYCNWYSGVSPIVMDEYYCSWPVVDNSTVEKYIIFYLCSCRRNAGHSSNSVINPAFRYIPVMPWSIRARAAVRFVMLCELCDIAPVHRQLVEVSRLIVTDFSSIYPSRKCLAEKSSIPLSPFRGAIVQFPTKGG
jgi:hypothetical protein